VRHGTEGEPSPTGGSVRPGAGPPQLVDVSAGPGDGWAGGAHCRGEDAALFFGPNGFEPKRERLAREAAAKAICRGCPALMACREQAVRDGELYGVWGGLGETDRRPLIERHASVATAV
jgi:WhiB family transcriptional regulator, redox-sensing transcriptional regulator